MKLVLEDGTEIGGRSVGAPVAVVGEVVFNTAMTGYVEALTDPSYRGQILVLTYPLIGNYGVPPPRKPGTIDGPYESGRIQVQGLVVQNYVDAYSHSRAHRSLAAWLIEEDVPLLTDVDTRTLTKRLREQGTMQGWMFRREMPLEHAQRQAKSIDMQDAVFRDVSPRAPVVFSGGSPHILLVDAGAKDHLVRSLLIRGATVTRAPYHADLVRLAEKADGILLGNGPGDPKNLVSLIEKMRELLSTYARPIFGVCLGHQILALAAGGDTKKLPYGHRGANQPVQDLLTRRCFVTSQNHGYHVCEDALPGDFEPWFVNLNDGTNEGIRARSRPISSVQFHPEATPGPRDTGYLFDDFLNLVRSTRRV